MEVLRLAFLSSGVLEFFTSLSIALVAVYFGFPIWRAQLWPLRRGRHADAGFLR
jgi:ABC-type transport system involved in cytochrome bd biosynthesis fused ATPase/permease subunit